MYDFKEKDVEYIKILMNNILLSDDKELGIQEALNLSREVKVGKLTMQEAEKTINLFVEKKWLKFSEGDTHIRLSARFLAEMESYLITLGRDADGDDHPGTGVHQCDLCSQLLIRALTCENQVCRATYHRFCIAKSAVAKESQNSTSLIAKCSECKGRVILSQTSKNQKRKRSARMIESDSD